MRDGPQRDYEEFLLARGPHYLRVALGLTGDPMAAQDLFQSAAERLVRRWGPRRRVDNLDAYFRTILVRLSVDRHRGNVRRPETLTSAVPELAGADPAEAVSGNDLVWGLLARLPARQRAIVVLRVLEDADVVTTAAALGISAGAVKSGLSRALAALREELAGYATDQEVQRHER